MTRTVWTDRGSHQETNTQTVWTDTGAHQETSGTSGGESFTLAATEAPDTAAFTATVTENFALAATEAPDTAAFTVTTGENLALAATEAPDIFAGTAVVTENFALAATEDPDICAGTVTVTAGGAETFILDATEAPDVFVGAMTVAETFALAATEAPDIFAGAVTVNTTTTFVMSATEAPDNALIFVDVPGGEFDLDTGRKKKKPVIEVSSDWEPIYDRFGRIRPESVGERTADRAADVEPEDPLDALKTRLEASGEDIDASAHLQRLRDEDEIILRLLAP